LLILHADPGHVKKIRENKLHDNNEDCYCEATISYSMGKILLVKMILKDI